MNLKTLLQLLIFLLGINRSWAIANVSYDIDCQGNSGSTQKRHQEMCKCTSEYLSQLQKDAGDEDLAKEIKEVDYLNKQLGLLDETKKIIRVFQDNVQEMSHPIKNKDEIPEKVEQYSKAINSAMALSSIREIISNNLQLLNDKNFKLIDLCQKKSSENQYKKLCEYINDNNGVFKIKFHNNYVDAIENFIEYYQSAINPEDPKSSTEMKDKLKKLIESEIDVNDPEFILNLSKDFSPGMAQLLEKQNLKLDQCHSNPKEKICLDPFIRISSGQNQSLIEELNKNAKKISLSQTLANNSPTKFEEADHLLQDYIAKSLSENFNQLQKILPKSSSPLEGNSGHPLTNYFRSKDLLDGIKEIDTKINALQIPDHQNDLLVDFTKLKSECAEEKPTEEMEQFIGICSDKLQKLFNKYAEEPINDLNNKLLSAKERLRTKAYTESNKSNQVLRNFIANHFQRECSSTLSNSVDTIYGCLDDPTRDFNHFKLGDDVFPILGKIGPSPGLKEKYSREEINSYKSACTTANSGKYQLACSLIEAEYDEMESKPTFEKMKKMRDNFWIDADPRSPVGYTQTPKASVWKMLGKALLPVASNGIGFAMANYNAYAYGIPLMEQNAMAQKQWMWDYDQANLYWMNNAFYQPNANATFNFTSTNSFNFQ